MNKTIILNDSQLDSITGGCTNTYNRTYQTARPGCNPKPKSYPCVKPPCVTTTTTTTTQTPPPPPPAPTDAQGGDQE